MSADFLSVLECSWLEILKFVALIGGGIFALWRYSEEQRWKRQEFATKLYKDFAAKDTTKKAMLMLDWNCRGIELFPERKADSERYVVVDRSMMLSALSANEWSFDDPQTRIRDIFDAFLGDLSDFEYHIERKLIDIGHVKPYLNYWADLMTGGGHTADLACARQIKEFIEKYDYRSVVRLFMRMNHGFPPANMGGASASA